MTSKESGVSGLGNTPTACSGANAQEGTVSSRAEPDTVQDTPADAGPAAGTASLRDRYLRLKSLGFSDVPFHSDFEPTSSREGHPPLGAFVRAVFDETRSQIWDITQWHQTGVHNFKKGAAQGVQVTQHSKAEGGDTWFARVSRHPDEPAALKRWEVFDEVLRHEHSKHEAEYTPNVFDMVTILSWDVPSDVQNEVGMKNVTLEVTNMYHGIPAPLNDRVFTVLLLSGTRVDLDSTFDANDRPSAESIVVQLPLDLSAFSETIKSRCHHRVSSAPSYHLPDDLVTDSNKSKVGKKLVQGQYTSIEKITQMDGVSIWTMATASDAKGVLPMWVQKKAVPGEVVKDVDYVYRYIGVHKEELKAKFGG